MNKVKILFLCLISMIININCSSTKPTGLKSTNNSSSSHSSKKLDTLKKTEIPIFRHVIEHDFNKQDSFQLISQWLAISYNNLEIYTDYINEEYGKIIGTVVLEPKEDNLLAAVKLTYIIEMKDNRFRLTTKNFLMAEYSTFIKTIEEHKVVNPAELQVITKQIKKQILYPLCAYLESSKVNNDW